MFDYTTLTLDHTKGLLYVGAREAIFALSTSTVELKEAVSLCFYWGLGFTGEEALWGLAQLGVPSSCQGWGIPPILRGSSLLLAG